MNYRCMTRKHYSVLFLQKYIAPLLLMLRPVILFIAAN